jgi:hypothetical protein
MNSDEGLDCYETVDEAFNKIPMSSDGYACATCSACGKKGSEAVEVDSAFVWCEKADRAVSRYASPHSGAQCQYYNK